MSSTSDVLPMSSLAELEHLANMLGAEQQGCWLIRGYFIRHCEV